MRRVGRSWSIGGPAAIALLALAGCTATPPSESASVPPSAPTQASATRPSAVASPGTTTSSAPAGSATSSAAAGGATPSATAPRATPAPTPTPSFDLARHSVDDPRSIWVVVDKRRPLRPKSWVPQDLVAPDVPHTNAPLLRRPAAKALERMVAAAERDGVGVVSLSAYRPYTVQKRIFDRNLASLGRAATERLTARPGYSEHQTGLADDLGDASGRCPIATCFGSTAAGRWLDANSWRYGWVLRYPRGQQAVTGIQWEPWHFRYVGKPLARHMHETDQPLLERVLGLPDAPDY